MYAVPTWYTICSLTPSAIFELNCPAWCHDSSDLLFSCPLNGVLFYCIHYDLLAEIISTARFMHMMWHGAQYACDHILLALIGRAFSTGFTTTQNSTSWKCHRFAFNRPIYLSPLVNLLISSTNNNIFIYILSCARCMRCYRKCDLDRRGNEWKLHSQFGRSLLSR